VGEIIISEGELSAAVFVIITGTTEIQKKLSSMLKKIIYHCKNQETLPS